MTNFVKKTEMTKEKKAITGGGRHISIPIQAIFIFALILVLGFFIWQFTTDTWNWKGLFKIKGEVVLDNRNEKDSVKTLIKDQKELQNKKIGNYYDGIARFEENGKYGFIRQDKKVLIEAEFDDADIKFFEGFAWVEKEGKFGFVSKEFGEIEIPIELEEVSRFQNGFAEVLFKSKEGKISKSGILYGIDVPMEDILNDNYFKENYEQIGNFHAEAGDSDTKLAKIKKKNGSWGFVNSKGDIVVSTEYDEVKDFYKDLAWVKKNGKSGMIDLNGKVIVPIRYDEIAPADFPELLVRIKENNLYGFANRKGEIVTSAIYEDAGYFKEGLAYVKKNNKYGFIDESGELVIPLRYDEIQIYENHYGFYKGKAKMRVGNRQGYVYRDGKEWWFD